MTMKQAKGLGGRVWSVLAATALASLLAPGARALEAKGDLNVALRLIETVPASTTLSSTPTGVAEVELVVDVFRATRGIEVRLERPDGRELLFRAKPVKLGPLTWTDPGGEPLEPDAAGPSVPARGAIRTRINVPLDGAAIHEIVVRVTGLVGGDIVMTEAVVRAALGVPDNQPVDDGAFANFSLKEGN